MSKCVKHMNEQQEKSEDIVKHYVGSIFKKHTGSQEHTYILINYKGWKTHTDGDQIERRWYDLEFLDCDAARIISRNCLLTEHTTSRKEFEEILFYILAIHRVECENE